MRITDLLSVGSICLNGTPGSKPEALNQVIDLMCKNGNIDDREVYRDSVYKREEESTTGIGDGIAIPHGKSDVVNAPGLAAMVIRGGVDFDSLDGEPVKLIFLIAAPDTEENVHLDVLSKLSILLMDEEFTKNLTEAKNVEEFLRIIDDAERARDSREENLNDNTQSENGYEESVNGEKLYEGNTFDADENRISGKEKLKQEEIIQKNDTEQYDLLAVTGCPTGIAHTYMAAESLNKAASRAGYRIKVETRGSGGAKNILSKDEIQKAECIIVAADTKVPMDRFAGKRVIQCPVSDGISKSDKLVEKAMSKTVNIYNGDSAGIDSGDTENGQEEGQSIWHRLYTHLMNGVSHMLPFVVGGGILIAVAFLIDGFAVDINSLTEVERNDFGTITKSAAVFKEIGDAAFRFMLPILAGFIAMSMADRPGLAVGIVGGYLASEGKSGFLGALVAGFVAGLILLVIKKVFSFLPKSLEGICPVLLYPLFGILLMGFAMRYLVEPPVGALNELLVNALDHMSGISKVILGLILGAMMSIDFGGPLNKAAYVFGTASITSGNYDIMAAVMIGGMVPPCAIALATLLFKKKFTVEERKSGPANFVMGLSFITEGAIPFAAADPIRVIPACAIGAAVAGAVSMMFDCTLMAPHGGIFVFPVVGNLLFYLLALIFGTVIGAMLLGVFKREIIEER